ncbi:hypothetical protein N1851_005339 [Merluccius polli]|uniref:Uncharacterized protein n=1 Tax=Merluccius polli TaxID=89951 RepID=A0AA47N7G8_MERPO|nr:hypothetical protein N1851_005339 [Merluccius polli]
MSSDVAAILQLLQRQAPAVPPSYSALASTPNTPSLPIASTDRGSAESPTSAPHLPPFQPSLPDPSQVPGAGDQFWRMSTQGPASPSLTNQSTLPGGSQTELQLVWLEPSHDQLLRPTSMKHSCFHRTSPASLPQSGLGVCQSPPLPLLPQEALTPKLVQLAPPLKMQSSASLSQLKCASLILSLLQFLESHDVKDPAPKTGQSLISHGTKLQLQPIFPQDGSPQPRSSDIFGKSARRQGQTDPLPEAKPHISTTHHHKSSWSSEPSSQSEPLGVERRLSLPGSPLTLLDSCWVAPPYSSEPGS